MVISCNTVSQKKQYVENTEPYPIQKRATGENGAIASAHPLASQTGLMIMKKGGNAVDAAIATQLALAVVYPGAGNIGGGGFMVARFKDGKAIALDYREKAPQKAYRDMYLDSAKNPQMSLSQNGHLASGVPGTVAGLFAAHKYALLPFATLIQPAIDLAEKGFAITSAEAESLNSIQNDLQKIQHIKNGFSKRNSMENRRHFKTARPCKNFTTDKG